MQSSNFNVMKYINNLDPTIVNILIIVLIGLGIFVLVLIIRKILHLFRSYSPNIIDGLLIILNFTALLAWVSAIVVIFNFNYAYILGGSALIITIVGISASYLGSNLMGGIFIIITRPFGVGDIVTYGGAQGIVTEIGLNYTKILQLNKITLIVPNANIVNAMIHNASIFAKKDREKSDEIVIDLNGQGRDKKNHSSITNKIVLNFSPNRVTQSLRKSFDVKKIVRFSFYTELRQDMPNLTVAIKDFEQRLQNLCKKFTPIFGFEPEFYFTDNYWRVSTMFVITAINAQLVFNNYSTFLEGIVEAAYNIKLGGI